VINVNKIQKYIAQLERQRMEQPAPVTIKKEKKIENRKNFK